MKKTLLAVLLGTLFIPSVVFAQTASSTLTSEQVAVRIAQLQAQIKELQQLLVMLQQSGGTAVVSTSEFIAVNEFTQTLSRGMFSDEVKELQRFLAQNPEIYPEGVISGYFGGLTEEAVKRFQEAHNLPPVGIVGPKTRAVLNETVSSGGGGVSSPETTQSKKEETLSSVVVVQSVVSGSTTATTTTTAATTTNSVVLASSGGGSPGVSTGTYYAPGGYYSPVATYVSEPTPPPPSATSSPETASLTPPAPSSPPPASVADTVGPTITSLSITPASTVIGGAVSFNATAEDPSGVGQLVYNIHYPGSAYVLRPNCNFNGVTSGTCGFGQPIDDGIQNPSLLGDYVIDIRIVDLLGNSAYYYANGTVTNGVNATHGLTIPAITISAP